VGKPGDGQGGEAFLKGRSGGPDDPLDPAGTWRFDTLGPAPDNEGLPEALISQLDGADLITQPDRELVFIA